MGRLSESSLLVLKNKSHAITCEVDVPDEGAKGVIVAQGGAFGGWSVYAHEGRPAYCYNLFGLRQLQGLRRRAAAGRAGTRSGSSSPTTAAAWRKGGTATLFVDGAKVGEGRVDATGPDGLLGRRDDRPRERHAARRSRTTCTRATPTWNGRISWVELDIGENAEDLDHLISADERYRVAMARQ